MTDLGTTVDGIRFPNPFLLASGPPGTNGKVIQRAFALGWGGVVCKTISLESEKIENPSPRYGKLYARDGQQVVGFENIELISDRPIDLWLDELAECKRRYPTHALVASIMEEYRKDRWVEIVERVQATGVDALELNLSCPHGLPERNMGQAMGQSPEIVAEVVGWVKSAARIPVWAKLTPNITHIAVPAKAAVAAGAEGISAINTLLCVIGIDLETLRPMPTVAGFSEPGGYSGPAIRPIALRQVMEVARACPRASVSGIGGIETARDALQFLLVGAHTVQLCTAVMLHGYEIIGGLCDGLASFMDAHGFGSLEEVIGRSLGCFTTHADLVARQRDARREKAGVNARDSRWKGDIVREADTLAVN